MSRPPVVPRWGVRLLRYLSLALAAHLAAALLGGYSPVLLLALLIGLGGAAVSTIRGAVDLYRVPPHLRVGARK